MSLTSITRFFELTSDDPILTPIVTRLKEVFRNLITKQIIDGQLLVKIPLVAGSVNNVPHKVGRVLNGYIIVGSSADSRFWDSGSTDFFLKLNCSTNTTVSLWVF